MNKPKYKIGDRFRAVVYRDLKQDGYDNQYEVTQAGDMIVKEQILLGQFGMSDIYIRHLSTLTKGREILIISYTDYELTHLKKVEIMANALKLLNSDR